MFASVEPTTANKMCSHAPSTIITMPWSLGHVNDAKCGHRSQIRATLKDRFRRYPCLPLGVTKKVSISKHQQSHSLGPLQVVTSVGMRVTKSANTFGPNVASCFTRVPACGRGLRVRKKCWPDWIYRSRVLSAVQCRSCRVLGRLRNLAERYMAPSPRKLAIASSKCP